MSKLYFEKDDWPNAVHWLRDKRCPSPNVCERVADLILQNKLRNEATEAELDTAARWLSECDNLGVERCAMFLRKFYLTKRRNWVKMVKRLRADGWTDEQIDLLVDGYVDADDA